MSPEPLPDPPEDATTLDVPVTDNFSLPDGGLWHRIHPKGKRAEYYGGKDETTNRWDDPQQEYGVLYVADEFRGAFVEVYSDIFVGEDRLRLIEPASLEVRSYSTLEQTDTFTLVDLRDDNFLQLGLDKTIFTGDHEVARRWSRAFFEYSSDIDGILYPSRVTAGLNLALFDRASEKVASRDNYGPLSDNRDLTDAVADEYGVIIDD